MVARLGDILIDEGFLSSASLALAIQEKKPGVMLGDWLLKRGDISRPQLGAALARQFEVPYEDIDTTAINPQIIRLLPENLRVRGKSYQLVCIVWANKHVHCVWPW